MNDRARYVTATCTALALFTLGTEAKATFFGSEDQAVFVNGLSVFDSNPTFSDPNAPIVHNGVPIGNGMANLMGYTTQVGFGFPRLHADAAIAADPGGPPSLATSMVQVSDSYKLVGSDVHTFNALLGQGKLVFIQHVSGSITGDASVVATDTISVLTVGGFNTSINGGAFSTPGGHGIRFDVVIDFPTVVDIPTVPSFGGGIDFVLSATAQVAPTALVGAFSEAEALNTAILTGFDVLDAAGNIVPGFTLTTGSGFVLPELGPVEAAPPAPEPATLALFGSALGSFRLLRRRRKVA